MDIRKLQRAIVDGLEDVKGRDIAVFNTEHLSPLFERVIIASGTSNRQTKALAASVRDAVKASGHSVMRVEGEANGEWIIVDCGAAVVHLMQPTIRDYYHLEEIWGDKPVKMKLGGGGNKRLAKSENEDDEAPAAAPRKKPGTARPAAGKTAAKSAATRPTAKKTAAPAKKTAAAGKKTSVAGKKASAAAKAPSKTPARKAPPPRTVKIGLPTARKTAAGKSASKPAVKTARKTAGGRPAAAGVTRTVGVKRPATAAKKASRKT
ncbi:ribosome silencing factor [Piscinibacter sakaiensis]|uniref:ribosome silencing factor n=1 Tax=Piscinibacter sakaiensis TaxID=1547922 RepID=UPI003AAEF471